MSRFTDQLERRYTYKQLYEIATQDVEILETASGYYGLRLYDEAVAEIRKASLFATQDACYLELRALLHAAKYEWGASLDCAYHLVHADPDSPTGLLLKANALGHIKYTSARKAEFNTLVDAVGKFPDSAVAKLKLAAVECRNGRLFSARRCLIKSFIHAGKNGEQNFHHNLALDEQDLKPLWRELPRIKEIASRLNRTKIGRGRYV
jgi:hypothetical protein